jgi:hypothetical protein
MWAQIRHTLASSVVAFLAHDFHLSITPLNPMAKNPASYQKRQRELDKKRKAEDKRKRRLAQKSSTAAPDTAPPPDDENKSTDID